MARNLRIITQEGDGCGTASLAMILTAFHAPPREPTRTFTQKELDEAIRQWNVFTAPVSAAGLAQRFGVAARLCNDCDFELIERMVRRNNVCQLVVDAPRLTAGRNLIANLHYVAVDWAWQGARSDFEPGMPDARLFQYQPAEQGRWLRVRDPGRLVGKSYIIRYEDLESRYWQNLSLVPPTGLNNFMIVYGETEADLDFDGYHPFDASAALVVSTNASEFLNAVINTAKFHPDALPATIKNAAETALGAIAFTVKTPGTVLSNVSAEGIELGKRLLRSKDSNVVEQTAGVLITGVSSAVWAGAQPVEWLGNSFAYIVDFID